ncbi:M13-type metalloendopeptidase [Mycoplasma seminis]|uniref:M13 family metallopeptidase n=1 Tax=Mycoplasma seminis TaxID=512749 RepID=A0ABY9HAA7_9MOLU|nr:M13 family metallopeptidase [Mycoplasma seminis]WLP85539.1 M13 family metallopeptidase [Mycoplasma seminis]
MKKPRLQDDFYEYVNYEWLQNTEIPADRPSISCFGELDIKLEKLLKGLTKGWADGSIKLPNDKMIQQYVKFYQMLIDADKRKELGWEPAREYLNKIESLSSFAELAQRYAEFDEQYSTLPLSLGIGEDFIDNKKYILWLEDPRLILGSKETYANPEQKDKLIKAWKEMVFDLLTSYGKSTDEANVMIAKALEFDNFLVEYVLSSEQKADYTSLYNLKEAAWFKEKVKTFDVVAIAQSIVKKDVLSISCSNPSFVEKIDGIYTEKNFDAYKALFFINNLINAAHFMDEETRMKSVHFKNVQYSIAKPRDLDLYAYDIATKYFDMPLGLYYAKEYFGEKAKADVEHMVASMIDVYKQRLEENTWLTQATKDKAILKLSKLGVMVGYPEEIPPYYEKLVTKTYAEGSNVFANVLNFNKIIYEWDMARYLTTVNPKYWGMSPATINAYFNPFANHIVFPAAILQAPYYDINQSSSANYGGIGAVIAHEISHAFDNNGAQFDENGSMFNWWTEHDKEKFAEKTQAVIELYNTRITPYGKVNGKLTVSENIADIGGVACALEAAQKEKDFNAEKFFENWVRVWRQKAGEGYWRRLLETDVHSPAKERGNVLMMNLDLFAETYDLKPEDKMYLAPEKRIKIW